MTPPDRKPPPPEAVCPRVVAEGAGRALQDHVKLPERSLGRDIVDEVHEQLRAHVEGPCELGPYVEADDQSGPARLDGSPRAIAFDGPWWAWFRALTPDLRANLLWLAAELDDKSRREALNEVITAQIKRKAVGDLIRAIKRTVIASFLAGALVVAWVTDQISNFVGKWPALKSFWDIMNGPRP